METENKKTAWQLAQQFVNCKMGCKIDHNPTKILRLLGPKHNDIAALRDDLVKQKERLDKEGIYEFERWYTKDIIQILDELNEEVVNRNTAPYSHSELVGGFIVTALKEGSMFSKFNWGNYSELLAEDLFTLFSEFDTDFRGDIVTCHKVGGKYVVVETERHPFDFDNQRYKTREPKEKHFYSTEVRNDKLCTTNVVFNTFEAALFHTMNPHQYSAMNILFESKEK